MSNLKAPIIFSPRKIAKVVESIKEKRPEIWILWRDLEDSPTEENSPGDDLGVKLMSDLRKFLSTLGVAKNFSETTELIWAVRTSLRTELGLWAGVKFNSEQVTAAIKEIKEKNPDIWDEWKNRERNDESYQSLKEDLVKILLGLDFVGEGVEVHDLMKEIRNTVLVEAGVWDAAEIKI